MKSTFPGSFLLAPSRLGARKLSHEVTNVWLNPARNGAHPFSSVFVLALSPNRAIRERLETDLAGVARSRGLKAVRSIDLFPEGLWGTTGPTRQQVWTGIKESGCDAIYTLSLLSVKSEQRYVLHSGSYDPCRLHSYYGSFDPYCEHVEPVVSVPGYYVNDKSYFLEGNVFLASTGEIQWSMQSIAYNPSDLECFSKEYALLLIDQLNKKKES